MNWRLNPIVALSGGTAASSYGGVEVVVPMRAPSLRCSALPVSETRLPERLAPSRLLETLTGASILGPSGESTERMEALNVATGSYALIEAVAAALPTVAEDERPVDAYIAAKAPALERRPIRRRIG